jgi:hypothetical protein
MWHKSLLSAAHHLALGGLSTGGAYGPTVSAAPIGNRQVSIFPVLPATPFVLLAFSELPTVSPFSLRARRSPRPVRVSTVALLSAPIQLLRPIRPKRPQPLEALSSPPSPASPGSTARVRGTPGPSRRRRCVRRAVTPHLLEGVLLLSSRQRVIRSVIRCVVAAVSRQGGCAFQGGMRSPRGSSLGS